MVYFLIFVTGLLLGFAIMITMYKRQTVYGEIVVDNYSGQVNFRCNSMELKELYNKRIIFNISHNAVISREEHTL